VRRVQSARGEHGVHVYACCVRVEHAQGAGGGGWKGNDSGRRGQETVEEAR
jgi:hypothetical protein